VNLVSSFEHPASLDLSIIIVSFNTRDLLLQCIDSIYQHSEEVNFEIFAVDNNSKDGSAFAVEKTFPEVNVIKNEENLGFSAANNQAIRLSRGRSIVLLNSDTLLIENCFKNILEFLDANPNASILGPQILNEKNEPCSLRLWQDDPMEALQRILGIYSLEKEKQNMGPLVAKQVDVIAGACFIARRQVFETIGLLDEGYFLYNEENDFCRRARRARFVIYFYPEARIKHLEGKSTHQPEHRKKVIIETYKSNLRFYGKYYSLTWNMILRSAYCATFILGIVLSFLRQLLGKGTQSTDDSIALKTRLLMMKDPK
jgi:GT2 family glycosyltransferase